MIAVFCFVSFVTLKHLMKSAAYFVLQSSFTSVHSSSAVVLTCLCIFVCVAVVFSPPVAVERNNLMRLSQSIPFTPVPPRGKSGSGSDVSGQVKTPQMVLRNSSRQFENEEVRRQIRHVASTLFLPSHTCSCLLHHHAKATDDYRCCLLCVCDGVVVFLLLFRLQVHY